MSKYAFSESFGEFTDKDTEDAVLTRYKKHVIDHILQHYEIHVNSHNRNILTSHQLLYYHVYGDYRLVLDDKKPKFVYKTTEHTETNILLGTPMDEYYLNSFLNQEEEGIINGIYDSVKDDGALKYDTEKVDWLNTELQKRGTGTKFNLPSIGTEIVKMHAYGNASDDIKKGLIDEMYALSEFLDSEDNRNEYPVLYKTIENIPDSEREVYAFNAVNRLLDRYNESVVEKKKRIQEMLLDQPDNPDGTEAVFNQYVSKSIAVLIESFLTNSEYHELYDAFETDLPDEKNILNTLRDIYDIDNDYDTEGAISKIVSALFAKSTQKYNIGDEVMFSDNLSSTKLTAIADLLKVDQEDIMASEYVITGFSETGGYVLRTVDLVGGGPDPLDLTDLDLTDSPDDVKIAENDLIKSTTSSFDYDDDSGDVTTTGGKKKKKGGGKVVLEPALIIYQRILLDTFSAIQILCHTNEWARQGGDNAEAKTEAKMRFLSSGVNVYASTQNNNQNKQKGNNNKKGKIKPIDIYDSYPNIAHFDRGSVVGIPPNKDSEAKLGNRGLLDELADWRGFYTLSILAKARKKSYDRQSMDTFYSSDILLKEIAWMATALSDGSKVLSKKEDPRGLMSQIQYTYVSGVPKDKDGGDLLQQTAVAPKETVFYEVDVPLLKEVIMTYTDVYNKSVIYRAFNIATKSGERVEVGSTESNERVEQLLKDAKRANDRGDKREKNNLVGFAIQLQPGAFSVDQPYGWDSDTEKPKTQADPSPYPGVTYTPKSWKYHVEKSKIPRNLSGAGGIPDQNALATDHPNLNATMMITPKTPSGTVKEADLARSIWQSVKTRTTGLFDLEGARPHEFMYQLFAEMDKVLSRSKLIKAPYPDAWFGTNIVDKLITDPMQLGETVEIRYYEEKLAEYIEALEKRYMSNFLIPSVLLTQTQMGRIKYNKNPEKLKMAFMERLAKDAASPQLVTTNYILKPYAMTVAIMRSVLQISEDDRSEFVAQQVDEDMRTEIRRHMYHNDIRPLLPREHPLFKPREKIPPPVITEPRPTEEEEVVEEVVEEVEEESQETPDPLSGLAGNIADGIVSGFQRAAAGFQPAAAGDQSDEEEIQDQRLLSYAAYEVVDSDDLFDQAFDVQADRQLEGHQLALPMPEEPEVEEPEVEEGGLFREFDEALEDFGGEDDEW